MPVTRTVSILLSVICLVGMSAVAQAQGGYGWICPSTAKVGTAPSVYAGYFFQHKGADFSFTITDPAANSVGELRQQFDLQGILLELMVPVKGSGPLGLVLGWSYLFPIDRTAHETMTFTADAARYRTWRADTQWWDLQAALTYDFVPSGTVILGFRYDSFQTNFHDPSVQPGDTANLTINGYIPFFGCAVSNIAPGTGLDIEVGAIGFPTMLGSVDYIEVVSAGIPIGGAEVLGFPASNGFGKGYFFEAFGEIGMPLLYGWQAAAFVKYSTINAHTQIHVGERNAEIPTTDYDFDLDRRIWVVGGRVSLCF
ncbi:MAG: hypothetical protein RDU20_18200 [Desulfomonilaceae bacterium]|nr:hypothetical protein [Desulfomonilaceae bacterium]